MKKLLCIPLLLIVTANAGCLWARMYNPAGRETFLWLPGVGELVIDRQMPSEDFLKDQEETWRRLMAGPEVPAAKQIPIIATVTDTP